MDGRRHRAPEKQLSRVWVARLAVGGALRLSLRPASSAAAEARHSPRRFTMGFEECGGRDTEGVCLVLSTGYNE